MNFLLIFILTFCLFYSLTKCQTPRALNFAQDVFFGADGPWQAVQVQPGSDQTYLYPGGSLASQILTNGFCQNSGTQNCSAAAGGFYTPPSSSKIFSDDGETQYGGQQAMNVTASGTPFYDKLGLVLDEGDQHTIPGFDIVAVNKSSVQLPNGSIYPSELGFLSLGGPGLNQSFDQGIDEEPLIVNYTSGWFYQTGLTPSASYGLHIGSVRFQQPGSLIFGGFDENRVIGEVGVFEYNGAEGATQVQIADLILGVEDGGWPFDSKLNINSSLFNQSSPPVLANINPSIPYLALPSAVCTAVADQLPVTFNPDIGLYTWNTKDPSFVKVVTSPAYLQFVFQLGASSNFTLKVPFALLNLTLTSPIVATPQPYFPCRPYDPGSGNFNQLGRAFLQAVFFGQNFNSQKSFLAQAPGPKVVPSILVPISPTATSITGQPSSDFGLSWSEAWTPLPSSTAAPPSQPPGGTSGGLSTGGKVGVGLGVGLGVIALIAAAAMILKRRRKRTKRLQAQSGSLHQPEARYTGQTTQEMYDGVGVQTSELSSERARTNVAGGDSAKTESQKYSLPSSY